MCQEPSNSTSYTEELMLEYSGLIIGQTVTGVGLTGKTARIHLNNGSVQLYAEWNLTDNHGNILDHSEDFTVRKTFRLWCLIGRSVVNFSLTGDLFTQLAIAFESDYFITAQGDGDAFEDWQVVINTRDNVPNRFLVCMGTAQQV